MKVTAAEGECKETELLLGCESPSSLCHFRVAPECGFLQLGFLWNYREASVEVERAVTTVVHTERFLYWCGELSLHSLK